MVVTGRGRGFTKGPRSGRGLTEGVATGRGALIGGCDRRGVASRRGTSNGEAGVANRVGVATRRRTLIGVAKGAWLYECVANRGRGYMKGSADWWRCYERAWLRGRACPMGAVREVGVAARGEAGLHGGER